MNKFKSATIKSMLFIGGMLLILYVYKSEPSRGPILPCILYELTGFYCPGCGMTRAVNSIMHMDVHQSLRYNVLPFLLGPMIITERLLHTRQENTKVISIIMIVIVVLYGLLRNIAVFSFLAPTAIR